MDWHLKQWATILRHKRKKHQTILQSNRNQLIYSLRSKTIFDLGRNENGLNILTPKPMH